MSPDETSGCGSPNCNKNTNRKLSKSNSNNKDYSSGIQISRSAPTMNRDLIKERNPLTRQTSWKNCGGSFARSSQSSNQSLNSTSSSLDKSVFHSVEIDDILEVTKGLCRDYICFRLKRSGYRGRVVIATTRRGPSQDHDLMYTLLSAGQAMEYRYPHLYKNLARQLGYVIKSEDVLRHLFFKLARKVVGENSSEFSWCRVLSLFCIAGALSVDCMTQGHAEFIEKMVIIFCEFIEAHVLKWLVDRGGWMAMMKHFTKAQKHSKIGSSEMVGSFVHSITSWFGILAGMASTGVGIYFGVSYAIG